jgi:hypothetical protein
LAHIIGTLEALKKDKTGMSRADKNEQVMRCYQFFDWNPKFLRQNEYQQLSIYHYSLQRIAMLGCDLNKNKDKLEEARKNHNYRDEKTVGFEIKKTKRHLKYYEGLLEGIRAENKNRIPPEVAAVLRKADSLDNLLDRIIKTTLDTLRGWLQTLQTGPARRQEAIAQRLKIPLALQPNAATAFPSEHLIPFSIHPSLVIKAFLVKKGEDVTQIVLSKLIRDNTKLMAALRTDNYDYTTYERYAAEWPTAKQMQRKQVEAYDRTRTHDAIRWLLAGRYFERVSPNLRMAISGSNTPPTQVGSLRDKKLSIIVSIKNDKYEDTASDKEEKKTKDVSIDLYFHQLDDTLFVESKDLLTRIVGYIYRRRRAEQPAFYKAVQDDRLPYDEIVKETARLQNEAMIIAKRLLEWEQSVLDQLTDEALVQHSEGRSLKRIGFKKVCQLSNLDDKKVQHLLDLRNTVFHLKIPKTHTFQTWVQQPELLELLGPIEFKKNRSIYQNQVQQD